jgi:hypothetical protein
MTTETSTSTQFANRKASRLLALIVATFSMIGLFTVVGSSPASASAYGCNGWKGIPTPWGTVSANSYCASLNGSGTYVQSVVGSFSVNFGTVCNYNNTAEFFDTSGKWYQTVESPVKYRCNWGTNLAGSIPINRTMKRGFMCSTLKQNGIRLTSVCHSIN